MYMCIIILLFITQILFRLRFQLHPGMSKMKNVLTAVEFIFIYLLVYIHIHP